MSKTGVLKRDHRINGNLFLRGERVTIEDGAEADELLVSEKPVEKEQEVKPKAVRKIFTKKKMRHKQMTLGDDD